TNISAAVSEPTSSSLRDTAAFKDSGVATETKVVVTIARSDVSAACFDRDESSGGAAIRLADVTSKPSSTARLPAPVSSTSDGRAERILLAGRPIRVLLMINRPLDELFQDPVPQLTNFLRGFSLLRKLSHA